MAQTLRNRAALYSAEMIVIGYMHSRLRELIFGGVKQSLLKSLAPIRMVATTPGKLVARCFACTGAVAPDVSVKTDSVETAQMLIDAGFGV